MSNTKEITLEQKELFIKIYNRLTKVNADELRHFADYGAIMPDLWDALQEISKYGLSTPVTDEQLQKEAEEYYQTRKGSIFSTRDEIILAHKAAARKHSVTPVLSEQEIKEILEKHIQCHHGSWDFDAAANEIAALTAHNKK